jgi:hypothetical protein
VDGPRGPLRLRGNHVEQPVYLARADGVDFHVIARLLALRRTVAVMPLRARRNRLSRTCNAREIFSSENNRIGPVTERREHHATRRH